MNGILLIDKPSDWTSNDVVCKLRGVFHERRIGHSGTLDPLATGLLVIFIGNATKAVEYSEVQTKVYRAGLLLGKTTDTQDITGRLTAEHDVNVSLEQLKDAVNGFIGEISQTPPMYSALKINGERLYKIAREGREVERKARNIKISDICIDSFDDCTATLTVTCSKGTYIRTLCNDIGQAIGCGGCMSSLRRISCGCFNISDAYRLETVINTKDPLALEKMLLPVDLVFNEYGKITLNKSDSEKLKNGNTVKRDLRPGIFKVYNQDDNFVSLCESDGIKLKVIKNFFN